MSRLELVSTNHLLEAACFLFERMPFGLINAGAEYSRLMSKVVDWVDDPGFESYLDDEILHTPLPRPHLGRTGGTGRW